MSICSIRSTWSLAGADRSSLSFEKQGIHREASDVEEVVIDVASAPSPQIGVSARQRSRPASASRWLHSSSSRAR